MSPSTYQRSLTRSTGGSSTTTKSWGRRETTGRETTHGRSGATDTSSRPTESNRKATTSGLADTRACGESRGGASSARTGAQARRGVGGGRTVNRTGNDLSTAHDGETKRSLLFRFDLGVRGTGGGLRLPLGTAEFFCVGENEVHVL